MPSTEEYYTLDQDGYKLLPKGMSFICHSYREKHKLNNMFSAANYTEMFFLIETFKKNNNRFGVVYRNITPSGSGSTHKAAIVIDGEECFILDPLGIGVGSAAKDLRNHLVQKKLFDASNIYISTVIIQKDKTSCGTLGFLFLKEALRMNDSFKEFMLANKIIDGDLKTVDDLPPNLLKYMQSLSLLNNRIQEIKETYAYYPAIPRKKGNKLIGIETLAEYVDRHTAELTVASTVVSPSKKRTIALNSRADKHIRAIDDLLKNAEKSCKVEAEIAEVAKRDYSIEVLGSDCAKPFLFNPIKKPSRAQTEEVHTPRGQEAQPEWMAILFTKTPPRNSSAKSTPKSSPAKMKTGTSSSSNVLKVRSIRDPIACIS